MEERKYFIYEDELDDGIVTIGESNVWWIEDEQFLHHSALRARTPKGWMSRKKIKLEPWKVVGELPMIHEHQKKKMLQIDTEQAERLIGEYDSSKCKIYSKPIDTTTGFALGYARMDAERQGPESLEWA